MEPRMEFLSTDQIKRDIHRQWPADLKARIVSESLRPGVTVQEVAGRYGVRADYLSSWRTMARQDKLVLPPPEDETEFAAIIVTEPAIEPVTTPASRVEIFSGRVIIRLRIMVATEPVDFLKGHDGLAALVQNELRKDPFTGTLFVFRSRKVDRLKLIY